MSLLSAGKPRCAWQLLAWALVFWGYMARVNAQSTASNFPPLSRRTPFPPCHFGETERDRKLEDGRHLDLSHPGDKVNVAVAVKRFGIS